MTDKELSFEQKVDSVNEVSSSFCLAKWTQVTIDLMHGVNHSCHHPKRHAIDIKELKNNPSALHNTAYKKEVRKQMRAGVQVSECNYCWNIENTPGDHYSDRMVKSLDPWSYPYLEKIKNLDEGDDYNPHYIEVMFDNACNFACSYCLADISSSIKKEMNQHGAYPVFYYTHRMSDPKWKNHGSGNENPYIEAFWRWLPEIWQGLKVFRITGGEPLLSKHTFKVLDYIIDHPQKDLTMAINSNLGIKRELLEKFLVKLETIKDRESIHAFELYVSVDTFGEQAQYIRQGLNYEQFIHNLSMILERGLCKKIILMVTFNILCLDEFDKLIDQVATLKKKYPHLKLDISYLRQPEYLSANIINDWGRRKAKETLSHLKNHTDEGRALFSVHEINKFERIYHWLNVDIEGTELTRRRSDFYSFVNEYDKRYNKHFLSIFPSYKDFYIECKKAYFLQATQK